MKIGFKVKGQNQDAITQKPREVCETVLYKPPQQRRGEWRQASTAEPVQLLEKGPMMMARCRFRHQSCCALQVKLPSDSRGGQTLFWCRGVLYRWGMGGGIEHTVLVRSEKGVMRTIVCVLPLPVWPYASSVTL